MSLSGQAVQQLFNGQAGLTPTLQVIGVKEIPNKNAAAKRYRLIISDGVHYQQAMLATQLNDLVDKQELVANSIVELKEYICNSVQGRKIVIVLQINVVQVNAAKIGNPVNVDSVSSGGQAAAAPPAAPQQPKQEPQQQRASYQQQQQQQSYRNSAPPVIRDDSNVNVQPIASLNPYQNRWTIKARVTNKVFTYHFTAQTYCSSHPLLHFLQGDMRTWSNARGEGKLFSIDLLDEAGDEIRGTFFKDAADKFFNMLQGNGVYFFSGGKLKVANKKFTSIKNNYEITFDMHSDIRPASDTGSIKAIMYSFKTLNELEEAAVDTNVDVIGVVKEVGQVNSFTSKAGRDLVKRELTLVDHTNTEIGLTLWGERASEDQAQWEGFPVLAAKGCKLGSYNGRSLSAFASVQMQVNPDIPEAHQMRSWYDNGGAQQEAKTLTTSGMGGGGGVIGGFEERSSFSAIKDQSLGLRGDKPDYITCKGTINFIKHDQPNGPWYHSCPDGEKFKVVEESDGKWRCERNNKVYDDKTNRFILPFTASDWSGNQWMTAFDDTAKVVLKGKSADDMELTRANDPQAFDSFFAECNFQTFLFRIRVKAETYEDEQRVKCNVMQVQPVDYAKECSDLISAIENGPWVN